MMFDLLNYPFYDHKQKIILSFYEMKNKLLYQKMVEGARKIRISISG
jgi:hypothetical protein